MTNRIISAIVFFIILFSLIFVPRYCKRQLTELSDRTVIDSLEMENLALEAQRASLENEILILRKKDTVFIERIKYLREQKESNDIHILEISPDSALLLFDAITDSTLRKVGNTSTYIDSMAVVSPERIRAVAILANHYDYALELNVQFMDMLSNLAQVSHIQDRIIVNLKQENSNLASQAGILTDESEALRKRNKLIKIASGGLVVIALLL